MSTKRKRVSTKQFKMLIEELEKDRTLLGRASALRCREHVVKWERLARKLNSVKGGIGKNATNWQQLLGEWKIFTTKKARGVTKNQRNSRQGLKGLERRLLALLGRRPATMSNRILNITDMSPLWETTRDWDIPGTLTCSCEVKDGKSLCPIDLEDPKIKLKRRRIQLISERIVKQQNNLINRLTTLESTRYEADNRQNRFLEEVRVALDRHTDANVSLMRISEAQAQIYTFIMDILREIQREQNRALSVLE